MTFPSLVSTGVLIATSLLSGGVSVALVEGFFHKPKEKALTEKEQALAEKERALAAAARSDTSVELIKLWMLTNEQLVTSNNRLESSNEKLQSSNEKLQRSVGTASRDIEAMRQVLLSLVDIIDKFMPILTEAHSNGFEMQRLHKALDQARSMLPKA